MTKDDYKVEFEEHRKEIGLDDADDANLPSRAELHRKNRKPEKKSGTMTINVILGLFTLIPVLILAYVIFDFYSPEETTSAKVEDTGILYEKGGKTGDNKPDNAEKDTAADEGNDNEGKDDGKAEPAKIVEKDSAPVAKPEKKPVAKPEVVVNPTPIEPKQPEKKPEPVEKPKPSGKTHTVANNETLYRISVNYYGSGSDATIEKIKRANGLTSTNIRAGQKLIIP